MAATLVDGGLGQRVAGIGTYMLWNDLLYFETDIYKGLNDRALRAVGQVPSDGDCTKTFIPYARVALIRDWERAHVQIGAYAMSANVTPGGDQTSGLSVRKTDMALDATYQFITDAKKVTSTGCPRMRLISTRTSPF